jgi:hypothetical protein
MESISARTERRSSLVRRWLPGRPVTFRRVAASALIVGLAVSAAAALDAPADKSGLEGILKNEVPGGLGTDSFSDLTGNWASWGKGVADLVNKLYTDQKLDAAGQRKILNTLEKKVKTMDRALADPRFASLYDPIASLRGRLARRVDVDLAILNTLEMKPEQVKAEKIKAAAASALDALSALEADLDKVPNGAAWLPYIHATELRQALSSNKVGSAVATAQSKLDSGSSLKNPEQRQFLARPAFRKLSSALSRLNQAEQSNPGGGDVKAERDKFAALVAALEGYEDNGGGAEAQKVHETLDAAEKAAIDGGNLIDAAVREHYMNYNLQIVADTDVLNKVLGGQQSTTSPVSDFIAGASVSGTEWTTTTISVELRPGQNAANLDLVLNGVTQSSTVGSTSEASVSSQGYHRWAAKKPIRFDGTTITTGPAEMTYVQPSVTFTGANTRYSGGLFGGMANNMAMQQANARRGESEAEAAQRLQSRVIPDFDARVDEMIQKADQQLKYDLRKRLRLAGVLPTAVRARSNDSYLRLSAEVIGEDELGGDEGNPGSSMGAGLVISIHESLLNNAVNQMKFAGQTMTDKQVSAELERFLSLLLGRKVDFAAMAKQMAAAQAAAQANTPGAPQAPPQAPAKAPEQSAQQKNSQFVFDKDDPIRFTIDDGEVKLVIRAGFKQEGQEDVPTQEITVPLKFVAQAGRVAILRGTVGVAGGGKILRSGAIKQKIETAIPAMTPLDPQLHIPRPGQADVDLTVVRIGADNGWLTLWAN